MLVCILSASICAFCCPACSLGNSSLDQVKQTLSPNYQKLICLANTLDSDLKSPVKQKKDWDDLSQCYLVFETRFEQWLNFLPDAERPVDIRINLEYFAKLLNGLKASIRSGDTVGLENKTVEFKEELILFYHNSPLDCALTAIRTNDAEYLGRVYNGLSELSNTNPGIVEYITWVWRVRENFNDPKLRGEFVNWHQQNFLRLRKAFSDYFEIHSWY